MDVGGGGGGGVGDRALSTVHDDEYQGGCPTPKNPILPQISILGMGFLGVFLEVFFEVFWSSFEFPPFFVTFCLIRLH